MIHVPDKYRESKEYHLVYSEIIAAAQQHKTVPYQKVAELMGLPSTGHYMSKEVGQMLGEISQNEVRQKRPMLSAIVVGTRGIPGKGFFELAKMLGKCTSDSKEEQKDFWEKEKKAVYETWKR